MMKDPCMPCPSDLHFPVDQKSVDQCQGKKLPGELVFKKERVQERFLELQPWGSDSLGLGGGMVQKLAFLTNAAEESDP